MTHPLLSRAHLEALLVATAVTQRDRAGVILADVDRDRVSPAAWALLSQLAETEESRRLAGVMFPQVGTIYTPSGKARALADRVDAITIGDLCFFVYDTLIPTGPRTKWCDGCR